MKFILHTSFFIAFKLKIRILIQSINYLLYFIKYRCNALSIFNSISIQSWFAKLYFTNFQSQSSRIILRLFTIYSVNIEATFVVSFDYLIQNTEIQKKKIIIDYIFFNKHSILTIYKWIKIFPRAGDANFYEECTRKRDSTVLLISFREKHFSRCYL